MTREGDLEAIRVQGKRIRTALLEVRHLASPLRRPRVGVIVPRFGHTAVDRNLVKRRLRELARTEVLPVLPAVPAVDVVIRAARNAYGATFEELRRAVKSAVQRLEQRTTDQHGNTRMDTEPKE